MSPAIPQSPHICHQIFHQNFSRDVSSRPTAIDDCENRRELLLTTLPNVAHGQEPPAHETNGLEQNCLGYRKIRIARGGTVGYVGDPTNEDPSYEYTHRKG